MNQEDNPGRINEHEQFPDMATREYMLERNLHWDQKAQRFQNTDSFVLWAIGATMGGQWVARREAVEVSHHYPKQVRPWLLQWMGAAMPDPITAYVAAETAQWGRA